ncbi:MAG: electron transporter RnfB [Candidatus Aminicenantes bacterium]|nr:MAG: electron transporter RnfB [Candidatus Aminicenantes bacterium]HHF43249.1 RnfABCDGE type electron transport complex subunit B [Candidatus Aminicenantes bacterium]
MDILIPILTMGILGLLFSSGLVLAYKKLRVEEDPRVMEIFEILPQANCGACGFSGCRAFAEAVVNGAAPVNGCPVGGEEVASKIASILGVEAKTMVKKVARIHCRGTKEAAKERGVYLGIATCAAAHLIGGQKQCSYGCLGFGDCVRACLFEAMWMGEDGLPHVDETKCTGCGQCVEACPRNIIELHPIDQNILVFCRSLDRGPLARKVCKNACIACGICVRACPEAIVLENNLAKIIDYKKIPEDKIPAIEKCPTKAIGRFHRPPEETDSAKDQPRPAS